MLSSFELLLLGWCASMGIFMIWWREGQIKQEKEIGLLREGVDLGTCCEKCEE